MHASETIELKSRKKINIREDYGDRFLVEIDLEAWDQDARSIYGSCSDPAYDGIVGRRGIIRTWGSRRFVMILYSAAEVKTFKKVMNKFPLQVVKKDVALCQQTGRIYIPFEQDAFEPLVSYIKPYASKYRADRSPLIPDGIPAKARKPLLFWRQALRHGDTDLARQYAAYAARFGASDVL